MSSSACYLFLEFLPYTCRVSFPLAASVPRFVVRSPLIYVVHVIKEMQYFFWPPIGVESLSDIF